MIRLPGSPDLCNARLKPVPRAKRDAQRRQRHPDYNWTRADPAQQCAPAPGMHDRRGRDLELVPGVIPLLPRSSGIGTISRTRMGTAGLLCAPDLTYAAGRCRCSIGPAGAHRRLAEPLRSPSPDCALGLSRLAVCFSYGRHRLCDALPDLWRAWMMATSGDPVIG